MLLVALDAETCYKLAASISSGILLVSIDFALPFLLKNVGNFDEFFTDICTYRKWFNNKDIFYTWMDLVSSGAKLLSFL